MDKWSKYTELLFIFYFIPYEVGRKGEGGGCHETVNESQAYVMHGFSKVIYRSWLTFLVSSLSYGLFQHYLLAVAA